jgi:serine phosphatase RsbU (regulator of sigma subunit)
VYSRLVAFRHAVLRELYVVDRPERLARALTASAAEPIALERVDHANRATIRAQAARKRELEQQRARAEQQLADAEQKLDRLRWRGRGRRGAELRTEIALQRTALRLADQKLSQQTRALTSERLRAERDAIALGRDRSPQKRLTRETPQPSRGMERERGFGIEL